MGPQLRLVKQEPSRWVDSFGLISNWLLYHLKGARLGKQRHHYDRIGLQNRVEVYAPAWARSRVQDHPGAWAAASGTEQARMGSQLRLGLIDLVSRMGGQLRVKTIGSHGQAASVGLFSLIAWAV